MPNLSFISLFTRHKIKRDFTRSLPTNHWWHAGTIKILSCQNAITSSIMLLSRALALSTLIAGAVAAPSNDRCVTAVPMDANEQYTGDTSTANFDYNAAGVCGSRSDRSAVWFRIAGTGRDVTVKLCSNNNMPTDFGIFTVCNSQTCKGYPPSATSPYNCAENKTLDYSFLAEDDKYYYVHVRSEIEGSDFNIIYEEDINQEPVKPDSNSAAMGVSTLFALGISGMVAMV